MIAFDAVSIDSENKSPDTDKDSPMKPEPPTTKSSRTDSFPPINALEKICNSSSTYMFSETDNVEDIFWYPSIIASPLTVKLLKIVTLLSKSALP